MKLTPAQDVRFLERITATERSFVMCSIFDHTLRVIRGTLASGQIEEMRDESYASLEEARAALAVEYQTVLADGYADRSHAPSSLEDIEGAPADVDRFQRAASLLELDADDLELDMTCYVNQLTSMSNAIADGTGACYSELDDRCETIARRVARLLRPFDIRLDVEETSERTYRIALDWSDREMDYCCQLSEDQDVIDLVMAWNDILPGGLKLAVLRMFAFSDGVGFVVLEDRIREPLANILGDAFDDLFATYPSRCALRACDPE